MQVNSGFSDGQTLVNSFVLSDKNGYEVGEGRFAWGKPHHVILNQNKNKQAMNVMNGLTHTTAATRGDILLFALTVQNDTNDTLKEIVVEDTFHTMLQPYDGATTGLNLPAGLTLDDTRGMNMTLVEGNVTTGHFDADEVSLDASRYGDNRFSVDLGDNTLAPGESVILYYTMQVKGDTLPDGPFLRDYTQVTNNFELLAEDKTVGDGHCSFPLDPDAYKKGYVHVIKAIEKAYAGTNESDAVYKDNLRDGDTVVYTVDIGNYHSRYNKVVNVKNILDAIPEHMVLDENSISLQEYTVDGNTSTPADPVAITPAYDGDTRELRVALDNPFELTSGDKDPNNVARNRLVLTYKCTVDTSDGTPMPNTDGHARTNTVKVFFEEQADELAVASGKGPYDDAAGTSGEENFAADLDGDSDTHSFIYSTAKVTVNNGKTLRAGISKSVSGATKELVLDGGGELVRDYTITLTNNSLETMEMDKVLDILPRYEELYTGGGREPAITVTNGDGTSYTLKVKQDSYTDAAGVKLNRLVFTNNGGKFSFEPGRRSATSSAVSPNTIRITYSTVINETNKNTALQALRDANTSTQTHQNQVAMYPTGNLVWAMQTGSQKDDNVGTADWDGNPATAFCYSYATNVTLRANSIVPYVGMKPFTTTVNSGTESYNPYGPGQAVTPGDVVAWEMTYGNHSLAQVPMQAGSKLVVVLPEGLTYGGFAQGQTVHPYLKDKDGNGSGEPTIIGAGQPGATTLVWTLDKDFARNEQATFKFRTETKDQHFVTYAPKAYLVPLQTDDQYFFDSLVMQAAKFSNIPERLDFSASLGGGYKNAHLVSTQASVDVFGSLGVSSLFTATEAGTANSATSNDDDRLVSLDDYTRRIDYNMRVNIDNASNEGFENLVLINRLPSVGDTSPKGTARSSEANVRLAADLGNVSAQVTQISDGSPDPAFNSDKYKVEYFLGAVDHPFTTDDWTGGNAGGYWVDAGALTGDSYKNVTALRVSLTDGYALPSGHRLDASFEAYLADYENFSDKAAWDGFGYAGTVNTTPINTEPLSVGVVSHVKKDSVTITKFLYDTKDTPRQTGFNMVLQGRDPATGAVVYSKDITLDTTNRVANGRYASTTLTGLKNGLNYSVREATPAGFKAPTYRVGSSAAPDGARNWSIDVYNTPITHTVTYQPNGGTGAQTDAQSPYYTGSAVTVLGQGGVSRDGHTFTGWNTSPDGSGAPYAEGGGFTIQSDTVLYAQWRENDTPVTPPVTPPVVPPVTPPTVTPEIDPPVDPDPTPDGPTPTVPDRTRNNTQDRRGNTTPAATPPGQLESQTGNLLQDIMDGNVPLGGFNMSGAWSLLNLICALLGFFLSIVVFIRMLIRRKDKGDEDRDETGENRYESAEEEDGEEERKGKRNPGIILSIVTILLGLLVGVLFLVLEDLTLPVVFINMWTPLILSVFILHIVGLILSRFGKRNKRDEEEEEEARGQEA